MSDREVKKSPKLVTLYTSDDLPDPNGGFTLPSSAYPSLSSGYYMFSTH